MNEFNRLEMALDPNGLTESCDKCNCLIHNWDWMKMSFLAADGKRILCVMCWNDERREALMKEVFSV